MTKPNLFLYVHINAQTFNYSVIPVGHSVMPFSVTAKNFELYCSNNMRIDACVQNTCHKFYSDM